MLADEPYAPCTWRWFYESAGVMPFEKALEMADVRSGATCEEAIILPKEARRGQGFDVLESGDAVYCHVTSVAERDAKAITDSVGLSDLVNLEYWLLFGWDESSLVRGAALDGQDSLAAGPGHSGDLTAVQLVYDARQDRIVRVAFPFHGSGMQAFDLAASAKQERVTLAGVDFAKKPVEVAARSFVVEPKDAHQSDVRRTFFFSKSERRVSFVEDPLTGEPSHLAVYLEWGTHEPWPNPTGSIMAAPKHRGDGYSVLSASCHVLDPRVDAPFMYFGGTLGDVKAPARQSAWYANDPAIGRGKDVQQVGASPYREIEPLSWPPATAS